MSSLDTELSELAARIESLPTRGVVGLFWACAIALLPRFQEWAVRRHVRTESLLQSALQAAYEFAASGSDAAVSEELLAALEASTPEGQSLDDFPSTSAQDCWICADIGVRVLVDRSYSPGPAIEFALEPVLTAASEELFGVSQVGSSDQEETQLSELMRHEKVRNAIEFLRWATDFLGNRPTPTPEELMLVSSRAVSLSA